MLDIGTQFSSVGTESSLHLSDCLAFRGTDHFSNAVGNPPAILTLILVGRMDIGAGNHRAIFFPHLQRELECGAGALIALIGNEQILDGHFLFLLPTFTLAGRGHRADLKPSGYILPHYSCVAEHVEERMCEVSPVSTAIPATADMFVNPARLMLDPQRARSFWRFATIRL